LTAPYAILTGSTVVILIINKVISIVVIFIVAIIVVSVSITYKAYSS